VAEQGQDHDRDGLFLLSAALTPMTHGGELGRRCLQHIDVLRLLLRHSPRRLMHSATGFVYAGKGGDGVVIDSGSNLSNTTTGRISGGNDNYGSLSAIGVLIQAGVCRLNINCLPGTVVYQ
jgi:hypothetical protein